MSEHVGTHMDAPFHFNPKGWTTDKIPLEVEANIFHGCRKMIFDHTLGWNKINNQISRKRNCRLLSQSTAKKYSICNSGADRCARGAGRHLRQGLKRSTGQKAFVTIRGQPSFDWVNFQAKVEAEDLEEWVSQHGPLPSKCLVLMRWQSSVYSSFSPGWKKQERLGKILPLGPNKILGRRKRDWADARLSWFWHHWDRLVIICVIIWFWESFMRRKKHKIFRFLQGSWKTLILLALEWTAWVLNLDELRCKL